MHRKVVILAILFTQAPFSGFAQNGPPESPPPPPPGRGPLLPRMKPDALTREQREAFQKAIREVWDEDDVREARESWEREGRKFQKTLQEAVEKQHPELRDVLKTVERESAGRRDRMMRDHKEEPDRALLDCIPKDKRAEFFRAHKKIIQSTDYQDLIKKCREAKSGEARFPLMRELRETYRAKMLEILPEAKGWFPEDGGWFPRRFHRHDDDERKPDSASTN